VYTDQVRAEGNRITLRNAPPGRLTLPYHYVRGVRSPEGARVAAVRVDEAPLPLIQVENPGGSRDLTLVW